MNWMTKLAELKYWEEVIGVVIVSFVIAYGIVTLFCERILPWIKRKKK
ncbi:MULTISPECIES: hypothetical protein [Lactobacillus]|nr:MULTISPECIES: hypothetical protein [Lactobacillus]